MTTQCMIHSYMKKGARNHFSDITHLPSETRGRFFENLDSRFPQNFTFHISQITLPKMYTLISHFSNHISCFTFQISLLDPYLAFYSLYLEVWSEICDLWNEKWESHFTFPRCQMWFVKQTWNVNSNFRKMCPRKVEKCILATFLST